MITKILPRSLSAIPSPQPRVPAGNQSKLQLQFAFIVRKPGPRCAILGRPLVAAAALSLSACASVKFDDPEGDTSRVASRKH